SPQRSGNANECRAGMVVPKAVAWNSVKVAICAALEPDAMAARRSIGLAKKNGRPREGPSVSGQRRPEKFTTGQRTRTAVATSVPRPALAAAVMSSSFVRAVGVAPAFQVKIWRFQAPPAYPSSLGMKFSTLQSVASAGNIAVF